MNVLKFISTSQAQIFNKCENMQGKLFKCNSSIYFNKQRINRHVIPKYAHIKFIRSTY